MLFLKLLKSWNPLWAWLTILHFVNDLIVAYRLPFLTEMFSLCFQGRFLTDMHHKSVVLSCHKPLFWFQKSQPRVFLWQVSPLWNCCERKVDHDIRSLLVQHWSKYVFLLYVLVKVARVIPPLSLTQGKAQIHSNLAVWSSYSWGIAEWPLINTGYTEYICQTQLKCHFTRI